MRFSVQSENFTGMGHNVLQIGDRFVKRWHCSVGQTAANVLLDDRYFLCGGIYEY